MKLLPSITAGQAIIILILTGFTVSAIYLIENVHVPGVSKDTFQVLLVVGSALCMVIFLQLLPVSVSYFFRQRHFRLAGILADLSATIAATLHPLSGQAAHAFASQAEIARELLQFSKARQLGEKALVTANDWSQFVNTPVPKDISALNEKLITASRAQQKKNFGDIVSICHESLAETLIEMGEYDGAYNHARNAIALAEEAILNAEPSDVATITRSALIIASSLTSKGRAEIILGSLEDARIDLERAVNLREKLNSQFPEFVARACAYLASTYSIQGENQKAAEAIKSGLSLIEGLTGPQLELTRAKLLQHEGECLMREGNTEAANDLLNKCLQVRKQLLVKDHPEILAVQLAISNLTQ